MWIPGEQKKPQKLTIRFEVRVIYQKEKEKYSEIHCRIKDGVPED